jgi:hypothetical protein
MTMVGNFLPSSQELHEISGDGAIFQELELLLWSCLAKKKLGDGANFVERSSPKHPQCLDLSHKR